MFADEIEIEGFAAPYGIPNTFNEVLLPRSFHNHVLRPIPMCIEHDMEDRIGTWHTVWEDVAGIWVRGTLSCPTMVRYFKSLNRKLPNLSISWRPTMEVALMTNRAIRFHQGWPRVEIDASMIDRLSEISLVDSGAYPNTTWKPVPITKT